MSLCVGRSLLAARQTRVGFLSERTQWFRRTTRHKRTVSGLRVSHFGFLMTSLQATSFLADINIIVARRRRRLSSFHHIPARRRRCRLVFSGGDCRRHGRRGWVTLCTRLFGTGGRRRSRRLFTRRRRTYCPAVHLGFSAWNGRYWLSAACCCLGVLALFCSLRLLTGCTCTTTTTTTTNSQLTTSQNMRLPGSVRHLKQQP